MDKFVSGAYALAHGAIQAGVSLATDIALSRFSDLLKRVSPP